MRYHIWTLGCQMNTADSQLLASELERRGHHAVEDWQQADIWVINTCVVRQSAEDKAYGRLNQLNALKKKNPAKIIGLMGCLVGVRDPLRLRKKLPYVDVFMPPSEPEAMLAFLDDRGAESDALALEAAARATREAIQDEDPGHITLLPVETDRENLILPPHERGTLVSAHVPVVYGCSHACTYCIIPFRRGIERSRPVGEIVAHVRSLARQGVKEITLLGQIVDRYGKDIPDGPDLADLLHIVHDAAVEEGIARIRFLTSHPNWMTDKLLDTVAALPRVMPHIEVPNQAGDDDVLESMKRGYTIDAYRRLIHRIRERIPGVAIHTDIIVGFSGETAEQFQHTYDVLAELRLDKAHIAKYSPRPHTVSQRRMEDDVPPEEKERRRKALDDLQQQIVAEINARYLGETVEVLVEDKHKGKWRGRTPQNKLVFFESERDLLGELVDVQITWTGPWSMQGRLPGSVQADLVEADPSSVVPLSTRP
ncbi:MAG: tRNA (N6-isopentenyl adenosine(37)-C2)-methylthiotransferase MiaB [Anaerolineae bacterium]|nr:tRNA (N6-isopentenyl adenosine(37)-C2)-methylthiotransferase MiaB [Anaerolineae bacterium]